jgi:hypothetical protein
LSLFALSGSLNDALDVSFSGSSVSVVDSGDGDVVVGCTSGISFFGSVLFLSHLALTTVIVGSRLPPACC